ncbi:tRNA pseudouridine(13) synthase TruD [Legionella dresdenensis]|uniref:tRNA pseudouridine synthase D n=1 Tax=Legionella dresdenensis TaxID=450200 RepID=A0ABV8CHV3_9GAMM
MFELPTLEQNLAFAYNKPVATGVMKRTPEDFRVDEILGFDLTGEGEHLFLLIEKSGLNTEEIVKYLSAATGKSPKMISYAGLKDRHAVTTQWLSIHCPGETLDLSDLQGEGWRVIDSKRHLKKLKIGVLEGNRFQLKIRSVSDIDDVEQRLQRIRETGVPNYFGAQRFGNNNQNLLKAQQLLFENKRFRNPFLKGIYYSAARSFLYNLIVSERIKAQNWNTALAGDVMQLEGTNSIFSIEQPDQEVAERIKRFDISPAAPLWGKGKERAEAEALAIQDKALDAYKAWCLALEAHKLERAYRPVILQAGDLEWSWEADSLTLSFTLPAGSYATSVVRELIDCSEL